jgi:hypothetical protein
LIESITVYSHVRRELVDVPGPIFLYDVRRVQIGCSVGIDRNHHGSNVALKTKTKKQEMFVKHLCLPWTYIVE